MGEGKVGIVGGCGVDRRVGTAVKGRCDGGVCAVSSGDGEVLR